MDGFNYLYNKLINHELSILDVKQMIEKSSEYDSVHPKKLN